MSVNPTALLAEACDPEHTPFDYIVIGSGAGGGSMAARLAENGRRVLVLEAGSDPDEGGGHEVYEVPGYHGAATEEKEMCWSFSVRHYADDTQQGKDSKYMSQYDPSARDGTRQEGTSKGGILYPRSSGLGGCTGHFAMIVVKPNDRDWNRIAEVTGDTSWRAENMQGYFGRIEDCLYYKSYQGFLRTVLRVYTWLMRLVAFINPRWQLDTGGHGFRGWQKTSFIDPELVLKIAKGDRTFLRLLFDVFLYLWTRKGQLRALLGALVRLQPVQYLDPNYGSKRGSHSGRTAFIPIATDGKQRCSLRERLVEVQQKHPDRLVVRTDALATRLIFRHEERAPRVIGVEVEIGQHLYEASPLSRAGTPGTRLQYLARREVIVAAGAFNTPQLLMLSGIGDAGHLGQKGIAGPRDELGNGVCNVIDLPGVGCNLQDRYEVSVISRTRRPFSTLKTVSFVPGDEADAARKQWLETQQGPQGPLGSPGLYATNGGALAFFLKTKQADNGEPDLFIFGAPAAFRGYYWGWSKDLLCAKMRVTLPDGNRAEAGGKDERDLWSWILLKAYTRNHAGTVRLRTSLPRNQPEINFSSFAGDASDADVAALTEGVDFVRGLSDRVAVFQEEIHPGRAVIDSNLSAWIRDEAWGHHACGTCRMGSDAWRADVRNLEDKGAVLDSQFRVHGVQGLRVVDTSVFPDIPGYFIVTPTFMVGEKAADVLLADSKVYPLALEAAEVHAIAERRRKANVKAAKDAVAAGRMPPDAVGLALSGGGVRSATFCLGVLQGLARKDRLRQVDFMSSVSGGGYIGAFLGQLYSRIADAVVNPAERVQEILADTASGQIWWLRSHARYLTGAGRTDLETNAGIVWRNLLSMHVTIAVLILGAELLLYWIADTTALSTPPLGSTGAAAGISWSPWWWTPLAVVILAIVPAWISFWLAPRPGSTASLSPGGLIIWLLGLVGSVIVLATTNAFALPLVAIGILLLAWGWQEAALWGVSTATEPATRGAIVRNRLSRGAGASLGVLVATLLWVLIDTFAGYTASHRPQISVAVMGLFAASLPMLRSMVTSFVQSRISKKAAGADAGPKNQKEESLLQTVILSVVAFGLLGFFIFGLDVIAHWAFHQPLRGVYFLVGAVVASLAVGQLTRFVNLSSLQSLYAARLARTYLGATNEERLRAGPGSDQQDVDAAQPNDDSFLHEYHPERKGGPLHLINVCVNETVDVASGRQLAEDKGLSMCLGPLGVSVGVRFHALWEPVAQSQQTIQERMTRSYEQPIESADEEMSALRALPMGPDPETFHVLASRQRECVAVEPLRLSEWMAISGAALTTGEGRKTSLPMSLLLGLFNVRLGYWWDSHIGAGERPGTYPPSIWRRIKSIPGFLFRTQATLLNEWRAYFAGPSQRLWYLSDGGHSENTGLYELIRRRVPFIIGIDASQDVDYTFDDVGLLVRRVRLDFGANITWIDPTEARNGSACGWQPVQQAAGECGGGVPPWIQAWLKPDALGKLGAVARRGQFAAALARIDYDNSATSSWMIVLKACLSSPPPIPLDVQCYADGNDAFPNQSTVDQFFSDDQWESYRLLGETLISAVIRDSAERWLDVTVSPSARPPAPPPGPPVRVAVPADADVSAG